MNHAPPPGWKAHKLNQLGFLGRGRSRHRPRDDASLYGGDYPFFQTGDVKAANLYLSEYSQTYNKKGLAQSRQWEPGTLCITIAANIAETAILGIRGCFPDSVIGFVADPAQADVRFIKYCMDLMKQDMQQVSHGTTQDNLSLDKLLRFDFVVPDAREQRKIAAILSAYDDLIENNLRRIKILEEMVQNLYREWFVKFRFPGHQHVCLTDSPLGRIPEGWEVASTSDVAIIYRGRSYKGTELAEEGGRPFVNLKCIERDGGFRSSGLKRYTGPFKDMHTVRAGEMVMAITDMTQERRIVARVGRVSRLDADFGVISMDLVRVASRGNLSETYLYAMLRWSGFADEVKQHANGVNVLHLLPDRIKEYRFVCPTSNIAARFGEVARPMLSLCDSLEQKNGTLRCSRDLLLPRLISGEVDVSELDIAVPEEAMA